jgi:hypothetical protein
MIAKYLVFVFEQVSMVAQKYVTSFDLYRLWLAMDCGTW